MAGEGSPAQKLLTPAQILAMLLTVGGPGSGLDADTVDGVHAAGFVQLTGAQTISGAKTLSAQLTSTVATGTAPFVVASTTQVANLNASLLGGNAASAFVLQSVATAKGDLLAATGSGVIARLAVGTNTWVLTADSTQASGMKWAAPASTFDPTQPGPIGGTTASSGAFTTLTASSTLGVTGLATLTGGLTTPAVITSTIATGTAPFTVASTTAVANLNASLLLGSTWSIPGSIGATTPNAGAFTTLSASSTLGVTGLATLTGGLTTPAVITSTIATGTAPFTVASTTAVANLNASLLLGSTWVSPGAIGSTTANTGKFTSLTDTGLTATRVAFSGTGGLLSDSADMTFASASGSLTLGNATATHIVSSATDATSSTAASVQMAGGLGVAKAAWVGTYLGLTSAAAPGSLANGQLWNDSTQACFTTYQQSLKQTLPGCVLATGDIQTITNTTTETSMSTPGSRYGTSTFPANFFKAGKHVRIDLTGFYNSLATPGNLTIRVKIGGTTRATLVISDLKASGSIVPWSATVVYFCQAAGVSGNFDSGGTITYQGSAGVSLGSLSTGGGTTVDTTASQVIELTAQWATASASNTWTTTSAIYTVFN